MAISPDIMRAMGVDANGVPCCLEGALTADDISNRRDLFPVIPVAARQGLSEVDQRFGKPKTLSQLTAEEKFQMGI